MSGATAAAQWLLADPDRRIEAGEAVAIVLFGPFLWLCPRVLNLRLRAWAAAVVRVFRRQRWALVGLVCLVPVALRIALLPVVPAQAAAREQIEPEMARTGGRHLVPVRYAPDHTLHGTVIYNHARVDESVVVWARELGSGRDDEIVRYHPDRQVCLFEADATPPAIVPYPGWGANP
jgi:hypothetical protein